MVVVHNLNSFVGSVRCALGYGLPHLEVPGMILIVVNVEQEIQSSSLALVAVGLLVEIESLNSSIILRFNWQPRPPSGQTRDGCKGSAKNSSITLDLCQHLNSINQKRNSNEV